MDHVIAADGIERCRLRPDGLGDLIDDRLNKDIYADGRIEFLDELDQIVLKYGGTPEQRQFFGKNLTIVIQEINKIYDGIGDLENIRDLILNFACTIHDFTLEKDDFLPNGDWNSTFLITFKHNKQEDRLFCEAPFGEYFLSVLCFS